MARSLDTYLPSASRTARRGGSILAAGALALAGAALLVNRRAANAERENPPLGAFVSAGGVRLHYVARGNGPPVVFLHGNGTMVEDMLISGVLGQAAESHRAIAFDRPGFGHSERPRGRSWRAEAQAKLLPEAFSRLGIRKPIIVGHSWGTMVALALALNHPGEVSGLVLASGYYYPTPRADVALFSPPAVPLLGDLLCYTIAPLIGEAMTPGAFKKMFAPQPVSARFEQEFPTGLMLRPSQIYASSQDAAHMISSANSLSPRYGELACPITILAGDADYIVDFERQALRLHREVPGSVLEVFSGAGHMIHHADPTRLVRAISAMTASATKTPSTESDQTASAKTADDLIGLQPARFPGAAPHPEQRK